MQETGRQGAPSLFATLPRTGLCTKPCSGPCTEPCSGLCARPSSGLCTEPCSGPRARLCSGPHGGHLLPHHRHRRTAACAAPVSSASSPRAVRISVRTYSPRRRPHLRPPPVTSLPHSRPRRPPCLPLPGGFFPNFRCVFRTRHATNVCTFAQHAENKHITIKAEKDNLLTESKLHFSGFPAGRHGATDP